MLGSVVNTQEPRGEWLNGGGVRLNGLIDVALGQSRRAIRGGCRTLGIWEPVMVLMERRTMNAECRLASARLGSVSLCADSLRCNGRDSSREVCDGVSLISDHTESCLSAQG
ncbi:hypothetical protein NHX12_011923 [Muraenolepis orangiensis]|uniref:Uncharacterized protein n=1 Tax=Muraenolepis orangiensis TaxID=630683 RepID=A0A9Q0DGT1_9TELE|nr:hypothetical protein NHX12_011923 [Muraenolepis orangiensis]